MRRMMPITLLLAMVGCANTSPASSEGEAATSMPSTTPQAADPSGEKPPAATAEDAPIRAPEFPGPGDGTPSYVVDVYDFAAKDCEYTMSGEYPQAEPKAVLPLDFEQARMLMYAEESIYVREAGGDSFGVGAGHPDQDGSGIVIRGACNSISMADAGYTDAALAAMRTHELDACCEKCDGPCTGCSIPAEEVACTERQVEKALCALWNGVIDCRLPSALDEWGGVNEFRPPRGSRD